MKIKRRDLARLIREMSLDEMLNEIIWFAGVICFSQKAIWFFSWIAPVGVGPGNLIPDSWQFVKFPLPLVTFCPG